MKKPGLGNQQGPASIRLDAKLPVRASPVGGAHCF